METFLQKNKHEQAMACKALVENEAFIFAAQKLKELYLHEVVVAGYNDDAKRCYYALAAKVVDDIAQMLREHASELVIDEARKTVANLYKRSTK